MKMLELGILVIELTERGASMPMRIRLVAHLFIIAILLSSILFLFINRVDATQNSYANNIKQLWTASNLLSAANKAVIIYRNTASLSEDRLPEFAERLEKRLGLPASASLVSQGVHRVYGADYTFERHVRISLRIAEIDQTSTYVVVRVEIGDEIHLADVYQWSNWLQRAEQIPAFKRNGSWNFMMQGNLPNEKKEDVEHILANLSKRLNGKELGRYSDTHTLSVSYYTPAFNNQIKNGLQPMNMQIALHQDTESRQWRWTFGTPIITIEY